MPDHIARSDRVRPFRLSGEFSFVAVKDLLQPVEFNKALLTDVTGILADVTPHIGLPDVPIRHDPQGDNHPCRDSRDLRNASHAGSPEEAAMV